MPASYFTSCPVYVSAENDPDLNECENLGLEAGKFAYLGPCEKLKLICPSPTSLLMATDDRRASRTTIPACKNWISDAHSRGSAADRMHYTKNSGTTVKYANHVDIEIVVCK